MAQVSRVMVWVMKAVRESMKMRVNTGRMQ